VLSAAHTVQRRGASAASVRAARKSSYTRVASRRARVVLAAALRHGSRGAQSLRRRRRGFSGEARVAATQAAMVAGRPAVCGAPRYARPALILRAASRAAGFAPWRESATEGCTLRGSVFVRAVRPPETPCLATGAFSFLPCWRGPGMPRAAVFWHVECCGFAGACGALNEREYRHFSTSSWLRRCGELRWKRCS